MTDPHRLDYQGPQPKPPKHWAADPFDMLLSIVVGLAAAAVMVVLILWVRTGVPNL